MTSFRHLHSLSVLNRKYSFGGINAGMFTEISLMALSSNVKLSLVFKKSLLTSEPQLYSKEHALPYQLLNLWLGILAVCV